MPGGPATSAGPGICGASWTPASWPRRAGDPRREVLVPAPDHPLLGFRACRVLGCQGHALLTDQLCATCRGAYRRSDLSMQQFITTGPARARRCGEAICSVNGCPRPVRTRRLQLCNTHEHQRKQLGLPLAQFAGHPGAVPLPGFGRCRAGVCDRQAHGRRGLCRPHDVRWTEQRRAGQVADTEFANWCRTAAPVASGHQVVLRGLAPRVQAEVLFRAARTLPPRRADLPLPAADLLPPAARRRRVHDLLG